MRKMLATLVALVAAATAQAGFVNYSNTLTGASPTFNRPLSGTPPTGLSGVGTSVFYHLQPFYVTASGLYSMETIAASLTGTSDDTFLALYQGAFNPLSPLTNALSADDDGGAGFLSLIGSRPLTAGTQYWLVTTTFANGQTGSFTTQIRSEPITGAGNPVLGLLAVPEPLSVAVFGGVLAAGGLAARRRVKATA